MLSRGDCLVLIKAVLSTIPTFFMSILRARVPFKIGLLRVPFKCADSSGEEPDKEMPEKTACKPLREEDLKIQDIQCTNLVLLTKWVYRMMQPPRDLVTQVFVDSYGFSKN